LIKIFFDVLKIVRAKGLEPSHLAAPDPKSGVSTNFTTPATSFLRAAKLGLFLLSKNKKIQKIFT